MTMSLLAAGNFIGPSGPVSPDRERLRGYSPERRPYSPEDDRRAYSPERPDRERAQRYQMQVQLFNYYNDYLYPLATRHIHQSAPWPVCCCNLYGRAQRVLHNYHGVSCLLHRL